jgi:hypothetical protein
MHRNNPWLAPPDMREPLEWGTGRYWDTTVARKHPYWGKGERVFLVEFQYFD